MAKLPKPTPEEQRRRALMMEIVREEGITCAEELYTTLRDMFAGTMEDLLKAELDEHLGYEKHEQKPKETTNRRNGTTKKTVRTKDGELTLNIPRDRESSYEPQAVKKGQSDVSDIQEKVMSMYAKGLSDRDISAIIHDIYGFTLSHETISRIIDNVLPRLIEWQTRPLETIYACAYVDAMVVKVKDNGKAINKAAYTIIGIDMEGRKDVLGIWLGKNEGAQAWMMIFDEIKTRGVEQILYICIDGLKELEQAIKCIYPQAHVQRCMVHIQRNAIKYVPSKHYKVFSHDAKAIYSATSLQAAKEALTTLEDKWKEDYPLAVRVWVDNMEHVERLFELPAAIRKMVYTTNIVEGFNSALRKVTRGKAAFPNDDSVLKALYLRTMDVIMKWTMPVANWALILSQIDIMYPGVCVSL